MNFLAEIVGISAKKFVFTLITFSVHNQNLKQRKTRYFYYL